MDEYQVWKLVAAVERIQSLESLLEKRCDGGERDTYIVGDAVVDSMVKPYLQYCREQCNGAELHRSIERLGTRLHGHVNAGAFTFDELRAELRELRRDIQYDLKYRKFAYVSVERATKHKKVIPDWDAVWKSFPASKQDSLDATDAYAVGLYTSAVFHAMRVAEIGLRALAKKLGVKLTDKRVEIPIQFGTWEKVIAQIKIKIDQAHQLPKNEKREKQLQFYSDAADRCGYLKELYRNPVSHARKHYIEGEALGAMDRARAFMELLAEGIGKRK